MKYNLLISLTLSVAMAAACNKIETTTPSLPDGYEPSNTPISFETEDNWGDVKSVTRGVIKDEFGLNDEFGLFAYYNQTGTWDSSITSPNFMNNQNVTKNADSWGYSPVKYWPLSGNISFFAYSPYTLSKTLLPSAIGDGKLSFSYDVDSDVENQKDFMVASAIDKTINDKDQGVKFKFSHLLTQVKFGVRQTFIDKFKVKILSIKIKANRAAEGFFTASTGDFEWGEYAKPADDEGYQYYEVNIANGTLLDKEIETSINDTETTYSDISSDKGVMLLPQNLFGESVDVEIVYQYWGQYVDIEDATQLSTTLTFNNSTKLPVGEAARFVFTLYVDTNDVVDIKLSEVLVEKWEDVNFDVEI